MAMCRARAEPLAIAIFARAPLAGAAKTRLIPALGAAGAARLQRRLTLHALAVARRAAIGSVSLWGSPGDQQRFFRAVQRCSGVDLYPQSGPDLGQRMANAFAAQAGPLLLIGTDCPALQPEHLSAAASALLDDVNQALRLFEAYQGIQAANLAALKADIAQGVADINAGRVREVSMSSIKERGRAIRATPKSA